MDSDLQHSKQRQRDKAVNITSSDPYVVLGLVRSASSREIKRAYFDLVRQYSPEENPEAFKLIRAAYEKLRTDKSQAETDLFLFQPSPTWKPRKHPKKLDLSFDPQDIWLVMKKRGDLGRDDFRDDYRPVRV